MKYWILAISMAVTTSAMAQWSEPTRITYGVPIDIYKAVASGHSLFLMGDPEFMRSTNNGAYWTEPINPIPSFTEYSGIPDIACLGDTLQVVFPALNNGLHDIYYLKSSNAGNTWSTPRAIYNSWPTSLNWPKIAINGDSIFVASINNGAIKFKRSLNGGGIWRDTTTIESDSVLNRPLFTFANDCLHVIFEHGADAITKAIYYKRSLDGGRTWSNRMNILGQDSITVLNPSLTTGSAGRLLVLWSIYDNGSLDVRSRASLDNGVSWENIVQITFNYVCYQSSSVILGNNFYSVFSADDHSEPYQPGIAFSNSTDHGMSWTEPVFISRNSEAASLLYTIASNDTILHCIMEAGDLYYSNRIIQNSDSFFIPTEIPELISAKCYPNPFNISTSVNFSIPDCGKTNVAVYDLLGRQVAILLDKYLSSGEHELTWNASDYSSGIYVIRLESQTQTQNIKLTLVK